jgi:pimeloyl-ACP methyl ester carboxylesterase
LIDERHIRAVDGTRLVTWSSDGDAERTILICNGLGGPAAAWKPLLGRGSRVISWHHRGLLGSERPKDLSRITVADHVSDALRVLDVYGVDKALVVGWSLGVAVSLELARQYPDRVAGVVAIAGAAGGIFDSALAPIPLGLGPITARVTARAVSRFGVVPNFIFDHGPNAHVWALALRHSGVIDRRASNREVAEVWHPFSRHDWSWYARMAAVGGEHPVPDLSTIECPVTFVAGKRDLITASWASFEAAEKIPRARVELLDATHFLPLEYPNEIVAIIERELDDGDD